MVSAQSVEFCDLIGAPFEYGARGPDSYDCYGLLMEMYKRIGIDVTDYGSSSQGAEIIAMMLSKVHEWGEVKARPGCAILIKLPMSMHVGFLLPFKKFIHTSRSTGGVTIEYLRNWERRVLGYYEPL